MKVYSPSEIQAAILKTLRDESGIGKLSSDQQIFDAVADAIENPTGPFADDILLAARIRLVNLFILTSPLFNKSDLIGETA